MATILIANSDHRFTGILRKVLAAYHHEVLAARTGEEALRLFDGGRPALVLLDLMILGLPGLEVLAKLRARAPHVPIVIVTAEVPPDVESRAREMGVSDVLRKRLSMDVIMQAVSRVLQAAGKPAAVEPASVSSAGADNKPATILLVDDEREICSLVGEFLGRRGYKIQTAYGGEEALAKVGQEPPDLVLLDIYMPDLNGVEVLRRLVERRFAGGVIMLTASQEEPLLKAALDLGAFDVLSKPVDLDQVELAVMVKLMLNAPD